VRRPAACLLAVAVAWLLAGCGNERQRAASIPPPAAPAGKRTETFERYGVLFERPANWGVGGAGLPQLMAISSGRAVVVLWRYRRVERLPRSRAELDRALRALVAAARGRDRSLRVISASPVRVGGAPGVQLVVTQRIGTARRRVRSTHLYAYGAELVVDAYAPPAEFARVDRTVFRPLLRSLRLTPPPR
jgi:hypothetical protein